MNIHNNSMQIKRYTLSLLMALVMQDASCISVQSVVSGAQKALGKISKGALQKVIVPVASAAAVAGTVALTDHLINKIEGKKSEMNPQDHAQKGPEDTKEDPKKEDPKKEDQQNIEEQFAEIIKKIPNEAMKQALGIVSSMMSKNAQKIAENEEKIAENEGKIAENVQKIADNSQALNGASANAHRVDSHDNQTPENSTQKSDGQTAIINHPGHNIIPAINK